MKRYSLPLMVAGLLLLTLPVARAWAAPPTASAAACSTGSLTGIITDATTNKPLAHAIVTVGYLTAGYQRAAETDSHGRYVISGLPPTGPRGIDTYAFTQGYFYHHGVNQLIHSCKTTTYSYAVPRDTTTLKHPRILSYYASPGASVARFGMVAVEGTGTFSFEMMAISPALGRLVVLRHGPGKHYDGAFKLPSGTRSGAYRFYFVATENSCFINQTFPYKDVTLS